MDAKSSLKSKLPSRHATEGPDRAPHRAFYYAMGLTTEQIHQPFVGVATCWNEAAPCNIALMRQAQVVKRGVAAVGGTPREFCTITVTDGIAMGHAGMKRVQAVIDGAQSTLEQAQRDVERYTDLVARNATPIVTLNNAQTQVNISKATAESNRAQLENLKVQLDFCTIRAPISGRISMANVKIGNFVRQADTSPMATIVQTAPVYVSFTVPQKNLPDIRKAIAAETATVEAVIPGEDKRASGQVTMRASGLWTNAFQPAAASITTRRLSAL